MTDVEEQVPVHVERGGANGPTVLLLHGAGATAAVWASVLGELGKRGIPLNWITVDLPGHGRSGWLPDYHHRHYAAAVGAAVAAELSARGSALRIDLVVGHSLGGLVALTLADGTHGVEVGAVTAMAVKVNWTPEQLSRRAAQAAKPQATFAEAPAARQRFARVSGMSEDTAAELLETGIRHTDEGYQLAADPRLAADPPATPSELAEVTGLVTSPVRLVCGDADPGIEPDEMAFVLGHPVEVVRGSGHNPHLEHPARVADLIATDLTDLTGASARG